MIIIKPTKIQIEKAQSLVDKYPEGYNNNSYRGGGIALLSGKLSEVCFGDYFGGEHINDYHYDFLFNGRKIEIKTKACSNFAPKPNWYCCVPTYFEQNTDYYVFARVNKDLSTLWFVGYISKIEFCDKSIFVKEGEVDPDSKPYKIWTCPTDSRYIKIGQLKKFGEKWLTKNGNQDII